MRCRACVLALLLLPPALPADPGRIESFTLTPEFAGAPSSVKDGVRVTLENLVEQETRRGHAVIAELSVRNETGQEKLALIVGDSNLTSLQVRGEGGPRRMSVEGFPECRTQSRSTQNCMRSQVPADYLRLAPGEAHIVTFAGKAARTPAPSGLASIALRLIIKDGPQGEPYFRDFAFSGEPLRAQDRELAVYRNGMIYSIGRVKAAVLSGGQQKDAGADGSGRYTYYARVGLANGARADAEVAVSGGDEDSYFLAGDPGRLPVPVPVKVTGVRACDPAAGPAVACRRGSPLFAGQTKTFYIQTETPVAAAEADTASLRLRVGVRFNIRPDEDFTWVDMEYNDLPLDQSWGELARE
ncbi:MAG: hypothetical protein GVX90_00445 [Alphaproteobacteria bacterium]|jgi:hypothetical protein|nr:hypothetical protein [Alphaproteobacteria bacterium]